MRLPEEPEIISSQINIVPMIDVIFAILTFFIVSSLFLTRNEGLPVNLPTAITAVPQQQPTSLTVSIDATGQLFLNKQPIQIENLQQQIQTQIPPNQTSTLVIINADEKVYHGKVIAVMDRLRGIPTVKLAIATQQP